MENLNINRRHALALLGSTALLAGCTAAQVAQWVAAEQAIAQEFTIVQPELIALGYNPAQKITIDGVALDITGIAGLIQNVTTALSAASTVSEGQSTLIMIETYVNAMTPVIWPVVEPLIVAANPGAGLTIGLIVAALPAVEGLLNFAVDFGKTFLTAEAAQLAETAPKAATSLVFHRETGALLTPAEQALALLLARAGR